MQSETFLHAIEVVLNQLGKPVLISDANPAGTSGKDYPIVYVNHLFEVMSGYDRGFIEGRNPRILRAPQHDEQVIERLREALRHGDSFEGTFVNQKPNGDKYLAKATILPVWVDSQVCYYVAVYELLAAPHDPAVLQEVSRILSEVQIKYKLIESALNHTDSSLREAKK